MKRLARVFALPMHFSSSPSRSALASPQPELIDNRKSTSNALVEGSSPLTPPILSPRMTRTGHGDVDQPILHLGLVHDNSFQATTAFLLGPDFGCDVLKMARRFERGQESLRENPNNLTPLPPDFLSGEGSTSRLISTNEDHALQILRSLDMSWKVFRSKASVQKYINTSIPPDEPWDFGICFDRGNGAQHCAVMHARGMKRTYTDHLIVREGVPAGNDVLAPGCEHLFWWCRPHPQWKEANADLRAKTKTLEEHYEEAKKRIEQFKEKKAEWMKVALQQSYTQLLLDLPDRERTTGKFSIHSMNTVLLLAEIAELLNILKQADDWNRELVRRRAKRLGRVSIHTCHARYRHAQLLYRMKEYDRARDVSKENLKVLKEFDDTYPLVAKQNILACAIAMRRRRIDQALEVVEHLCSLEENHPGDLKTKDMALEVLYDAHSFKRDYGEAEGYKRKQIEIYEGGYGELKGKGQCYYQLGSCLRRQEKFQEGVEASKKAISIYKECLGEVDEDLFDACQQLGNCLFDLKDWSKARFYIDRAVKGYTVALGGKAEKTEKAREALRLLEKNAQITRGLAERLLAKHEENKKKRKF
jgi:tetratricopeptide (TPR) repeat protein